MGEEDVDNDETACILANLIYEAKVKVIHNIKVVGCLSHEVWLLREYKSIPVYILRWFLKLLYGEGGRTTYII